MSKIQIIVDGSSGIIKAPQRRIRGIGWGIVAHHDGETHEISGCRPVSWGFDGFHEHIAFIEGVMYALARGFSPSDISIYSDHDLLAWSNMYMHKPNGMMHKRFLIKEQLYAVCAQFYNGYTGYRKVKRVMERGQVHHMKGHRLNVDMNRADYLARFGVKKLFEGDFMQEPLKYEKWLAGGFHYYDDDRVQQQWIPPFSRTLKSNLLPGQVGI